MGGHCRRTVHRHGLPFQHDKGSHGLRQILHSRPGLRGAGNNLAASVLQESCSERKIKNAPLRREAGGAFLFGV